MWRTDILNSRVCLWNWRFHPMPERQLVLAQFLPFTFHTFKQRDLSAGLSPRLKRSSPVQPVPSLVTRGGLQPLVVLLLGQRMFWRKTNLSLSLQQLDVYHLNLAHSLVSLLILHIWQGVLNQHIIWLTLLNLTNLIFRNWNPWTFPHQIQVNFANINSPEFSCIFLLNLCSGFHKVSISGENG